MQQFDGNKEKGRTQGGGNKKTKHAKFSENEHYHMYVCVSGGKKCSFFGELSVVCLLITFVLRFASLPYYRRIMVVNLMKNSKIGHI